VQVQTPAPPAPPTPEAPIIGQTDANLAGLQAQATVLRVQLAGLQAQWSSLKSQLDQMLRNNPARPGVQQRWADVAVQRAQVEGNLAQVEAQIAQLTGSPFPSSHGRAPNFGFGGRVNPNVGIPIGAVVFLAMLLPVSIAWAKRIGRPPVRPASLSREATERLERMEQAIDAVAIEVERISEGQRFVTKILAERPKRAEPASAAPQESSPAPQVRALGAGPAELVQLPERQATPEQVRANQ